MFPKKVFREIDHSTLDSTQLYVFDICNLRALTIKVKPNYIIVRYLNTRLGAQYQERFLQSKSTFDIGVLFLTKPLFRFGTFFAKAGKALLINKVTVEHHKIS